jgi:transcriptional regulator
MYLPKHFAVDNPTLLAQIIHEYPLATLVGSLNGQLEVNHLPLMLSADKKKLYGHIARMNPLIKIAQSSDTSVTAIFNGPNAYITPAWYPSKKESGKVVPTWNYAVVHAQGNIKLIENAQWLRSHVAQMTDIHEPTHQSNWKLDDAPEEYVQTMLKARGLCRGSGRVRSITSRDVAGHASIHETVIRIIAMELRSHI